MPAPAIKICGLTAPDALDAAVAARVDFGGLVFYPPSPRHTPFDRAAALAARAGERLPLVGVFVDPDDLLLGDAVAAGRLAALQLHRVTAARRAAVKARFGLPVWGVIAVSKPADIAGRQHFEAADRLLYDAKTPVDAALPGGMGLAFDWTMLAGLTQPLPWGLAGGLTPSNVAEAVRITGAPLVDVSSGVESAPGIKDLALIAAFCAAARAA